MPANDTSAFNDPQLGEAFSSIANAFAPPSAQALAAYARSAAVQQRAKHVAELWQKAQDPHIDQALLDRLNIAAGTYAPNVGYYGVGVKDATIRRGQDIESADRRYATGR
jgi:hypothetical protein